jgi:hypothetical protein
MELSRDEAVLLLFRAELGRTPDDGEGSLSKNKRRRKELE